MPLSLLRISELDGNTYYTTQQYTKLLHHSPLPSLTSCGWLTLYDLVPGSFEVMAGANLSDHDQHAMVSVLECSSGVVLSAVLNTLLRFYLLHRGSGGDRDFHGNSATNGR